MSTEETIAQLLAITRQEGHFQFRNLLHSDVKFVSDALFEDLGLAIGVTELLAEKLYRRLQEKDPLTHSQYTIDGVLGVSGGGKILATWIAYSLQQKHVRVNKVVLTRRSTDGNLMMETGFRIREHEHYLVVEDVVTTGSSVADAMKLVRLLGANVTGVGYLIDRSGGKVNFHTEIQECLVKPDVKQWPMFECPLCQEGKIPVDRDLVHR